MAGKPRTSFHYFDKGDMATIGRQAAVANVQWPFKAHWSGLLAWLAWVVGAYLLPDWLSQPPCRLLPVGVDLSHLQPRRAPHYRQPVLPGWGQQAGIRPQVMRAPLDSTSPLLGRRPVPPATRAGARSKVSRGELRGREQPAAALFTVSGACRALDGYRLAGVHVDLGQPAEAIRPQPVGDAQELLGESAC